MSCGFGAVILIYIIINHSTEATSQEVNAQVLSEITRIEELVKDETEQLMILKNTVVDADDEIVTTEDAVKYLIEQIREMEQELAALIKEGASKTESIEKLKSELQELEEEAANLEGSITADESSGTSLRTIVGEGDRQYLTGMKVGGDHILILIDASASMLDKTIVNIIRRRNMSDESKRESEKWQRAIATVDWILANLPKQSKFQLVTFNETSAPLMEGGDDGWLSSIERSETDAVMDKLQAVIPNGGTSLHHPFSLASAMDPPPDNIFLIVDSLPTIGETKPDWSVVNARDRVDLFRQSIDLLPFESPVNVILFPMEGDPIAAPSYWRLAQITGGSFLSPPKDWP